MWTILLFCAVLRGVWCDVVVGTIKFELGLTNAFESRYGWPILDADNTYFLIMTCSAPMLSLNNLGPYPPSKDVAEIHVAMQSCTLPTIPLAQMFQKLQLNVTKVKELKFIDSLLPGGIPENYTTGLRIRSLELRNVINFKPSDSFFKKIRDLTHLVVDSMEMPHLPRGVEFRLLGLSVRNTSIKRWENCESVTMLKISGLSEEQLPEKWSDDCYRLRTLEMTELTQDTVKYLERSMIGSPDIIPTPMANIRNLTIHNCSLEEYPMTFLTNAISLQKLDLSNNPRLLYYFANFKSPKFPVLQDLVTLDMSYCNMVNQFFVDALPGMAKLRELYLGGNQLDMDSHSLTSALSELNSLQQLSIQKAAFVGKAFQHYRFQSLTRVNWTGVDPREINVLMLHALPSTEAATLEVDLRGRTAKHVVVGTDFDEYYEYRDISQLWLLKKGYKLTVWLDSVACDCSNGALASALRDFPHFVSMPGLKCTGKDTLLLEEPMDNLLCRKATVNGCTRKINIDIKSWDAKYTTVADCSNVGYLRWPRPQGFRGFNATGNGIITVQNAYLPDTLEWIDLSHNNISRMRSEDISRLFAPKRRLWFCGNPVLCDCENRDLLEALKTYQSKVQDFDAVTCSNNGQLLREISIAELCRVDLYLISIVLGTSAILIAMTALILNHYWSDLKAVLYARGWCLYCLKEQDIDADRPYDAFVSFAHGDDEYVVEYLVPKLEAEPNFYKVCVHYRDWPIGEWIPVQIMNSVRESKRTIIVLSKNFVSSWWGALEFRHAYANALNEGRNRLLVLILDDVLNEDLSPELRGYLKKNTYLTCDDPWFWDKLRYAMPHVRKPPQEASAKDGISNKGKDLGTSNYVVNTMV